MLHLRFLIVVLTILASPSHATKNDKLIFELEKRSLQYFLDNSNPDTGLVLDRVSGFVPRPASNHIASLAATGYSMVVIANASKRGWVSHVFADEYIQKTLRFVHGHVSNFHGFYQHWIDWKTGSSQWESDFSTIDTALFVAGALYAAEVLNSREVSSLANQLYTEMDFYPMMTDGGVYPNRRTISISYSQDSGYSPWQWSIYAENIILYILALGSPTHALPADTWSAFDRGWGDVGEPTPIIGWDMPLFIHQYSMAFLDLRGFEDGQPNYFTNSLRATLFNRRLSLSLPSKTFQAGFWGLSAGDAPNKTQYAVYGPGKHKTTTCIGCVLGSVMFSRDLILDDVQNWLNGPFANQIVGRYGIVDSVDIDQNWFSQDFLAITVGTAYMSLVNADGGPSIWEDFMKIPAIEKALTRARSVPPIFWQAPKPAQ